MKVNPFSITLLSMGLILTGQYDNAITELKNIKYFPGGKKGIMQLLSYYQLLFASYLGLQNIAKAEEILQTLNQLLISSNMSSWKTTVINLQYSLNIEKSLYDGVLEHLALRFAGSETKLQRVGIKLSIGIVTMRLGDIENSKEAFEYVIKNGNKLYDVTEAKEYLTQINQNLM